MRVSNLALLAFLALHACSRGVDPVVEAETATFVVDPVSAVGEEATGSGAFANVPTSRLLNFTACVKDVAVLEPISNVPFTISEAGREIKRTTSDAKGCLYWSETIPFAAANQESYLEVERTITASNVHKGRVSLRLALNPWKKGGDSLRDLRFQSAPLSPSAPGAQKSAGQTGLVIESLSADLEIVRSADAVAEANLQLSFEPKLQRLGLDGGVILENLTSGKFLVRVQLLALSADAVLPLSAIEEFKEHTFTKGTIQLRSRVKILRKIPREASLELSFEAVPLDAPESLKPLKGRVSLGRLSSLSISKSAPLRLEPQLNFLEPLPSTNQQTAFGFELGKVRAEDVVVKELDSSGNPRLLELELVTCLRNSISQEKIQSQSFTVQVGEQTRQLNSDPEEGCLRWKQNYPFDFHAKESFLKLEIQVQSANEFYGREKVKRVAHLNLWKFGEPSQLVVDEEYEGAPSSSVADGKSGSELLVPNAMFNFLGRTFEIDSHLNLSTIRKYRFEIQPKIRRLSRDKGWLPPMGTGNGRYQIRFLLETIDPNNPVVVSAQTVEAESRADVITSTVDFKLDDIRLVSTRLNLSIQVLPIDGARSLEAKPYVGPFDMGGFSVRLEPRAGNIDDRMKGVRPNSALIRRSAEIFAQANKHEWISPEKLNSLGLSLPELDAYLQTGNKKGIGRLCSLFFDPKGWFSSYGACSANPESYLVLAKTEHVRQVKSSQLAAQPQSSALSISAGINFAEFESDDESKSKSRSYSVDSGIRLGVPILNALGLNIGVGVGASDSWNSSKSLTKGKSRGAGRSGDITKQVLVDEAKFKINGEVESCLLFADRSDPKKVYMACGSTRAKTFSESYYLLYQPAAASALMDPAANLAERPFLSLVRGTTRFQSFVKTLQDPEVTLNFSKSLPAPADVMREAENRYDGFFPGLLTPTE
jgi:hypothetical protein